MNSIELMKEFLEEHKSQYKGKYRFFSGYRHEEYGYKAQYYIYDQSFRKNALKEIRRRARTDKTAYGFGEKVWLKAWYKAHPKDRWI